MSSAEKLIVELIRRGATLLKEPCPKCGGLMVKYKGKNVCPVCLKVKSVKEIEEGIIPKEGLEFLIIETIEKRVLELVKKLESVSSYKQEKELMELIFRYYQLLNEVAKYRERKEK